MTNRSETDLYIRAFVLKSAGIDFYKFIDGEDITSSAIPKIGETITTDSGKVYKVLDMADKSDSLLKALLVTPLLLPIPWTEEISDQFHSEVRLNWGIKSIT